MITAIVTRRVFECANIGPTLATASATLRPDAYMALMRARSVDERSAPIENPKLVKALIDVTKRQTQ
jgi:hypothetical protein